MFFFRPGRVFLLLVRDQEVWHTFGTNLKGETTDERTYHFPLSADWGPRLTAGPASGPRWRGFVGPWREWDHRGRLVREVLFVNGRRWSH